MKDKDIKINLYRLKSIIIQHKYIKNIKKQNEVNNIANSLRTYIKNLKEINLIYTCADNESLIYGSTSYPDTLIYDEILYRNNFFAIILGFIDGNINNDNSKYLNNILNTFRNQVVIDYKENISICDPKILIDIVETIPCYINLINSFSNNNNKYESIKINFLSNYTLGYSSYNKNLILEIYYLYLHLIKELKDYKKINREKTDKIRSKKKCL